MENYRDSLINSASKLDAVTDSCGEITKLAALAADGHSKEATVDLLKRISAIIDNPTYQVEIKRVARLVHTNLIEFYGYISLQSLCADKSQSDDTRTLPELLDDLNALVGLDEVKEKVHNLIAYQKVQQLRRENNLFSEKSTLHMAFTGNPGTGKTTVARIVGRIYKQLGLLSKGHFIEASRTDLIAGYQGQTALKVKQVIEKAMGGVLFIDEAYSITENDHSDSYGRECLTELTKALEDYRDDLVVIVAGYTEPMDKFFESNPGLKSRFNTFIRFPDYNSDELEQILASICQRNDYILDSKLLPVIHNFFDECISKKECNFANGRLARNIYDDLVMNHAKRIFGIKNPSKHDLSMIRMEDFARH